MVSDNLKGKQLRVLCKSSAKELLRGNWGVFVGTTILLFILTFLLELTLVYIPFVGSIISSVISTLLTVGQMSMSLLLLGGKKPKLSNMFDGFKYSPMKILGLFLLLTVMLTPLMIVAIGVSVLFVFESVLTPFNLGFIGILLMLLSIVGAIVVSTVLSAYFFAAFYMVLEGEKGSIVEIFKASKQLMKGMVWDYTIFSLSFIGLHLTMFITCGLSILWITPYVSVSSARYYMYLKDKYNKNNCVSDIAMESVFEVIKDTKIDYI